jgi:hypothetical protein
MSSEAEAVAWLRAQIESDRALAERMAKRFVRPPDRERPGEPIWPPPSIERKWQRFEDPEVRAGLDFTLAHSPHDVLADCEAKLALVDEMVNLRIASIAYPDEAGPESAGVMLGILAGAYRHREGYAERWGVKVTGSTTFRGSMSEPFRYATYEPPTWEPKP